MALKKGTVLNNKYKIVRVLGQGAMGRVYLVQDIKNNKEIVIKELIFTSSGPSPEKGTEIFRREAEFMSRISHPGVPEVYEFFNENNHEYIAMEYIEGKTLEGVINETEYGMGEKKAIKWIIDLAEIMDYLHNAFSDPLIYRDLKPSNIIISPEGEAKLVDFGIARYYVPDKDTDTFSLGSPGYGAPEQYRGKGQSTPQTDIFALGVILFQLLTKYDPTIKPLIFPGIEKLNPSISKELKYIVMKAIELDPSDRYISIKDFKERLKKYYRINHSDRTEQKHSREEKIIPERSLEKNSGCKIPLLGTGIMGSILIIVIVYIIQQYF